MPLDLEPTLPYFMGTMNWDWDKLQEKRQRQNWRRDQDDQHDQHDDRESGGGGGGFGGGGNIPNTLKNLNIQLPQGSGGIKYVILAGIVAWLLSGIFIVNPEEEGVVLRFGQYVRTVPPGPHYRLPFPFESVERPNVTQVRRVEVGFQSLDNASTYRQGQARILPEEASMLTGDENIVNIQFSVQYQIKNSVYYLFNVTDQHAVVKNAAEAVMREVIGNSLIDSALADGKLRIQTETAALLQDLLDHYRVGVRILGVQLQDVHPPKEVSDAFKDVASAREDKIRLINEAEADRNEMLPKARGLAAEIINQATAYKETRILGAQGETQRFLAVLDEYNRAQDVTRQRMYMEAMEEILSRPGLQKLILSTDGASALPLLPLDRMMPAESPSPRTSGQATVPPSAIGSTQPQNAAGRN